jgi:hypothetical protein
MFRAKKPRRVLAPAIGESPSRADRHPGRVRSQKVTRPVWCGWRLLWGKEIIREYRRNAPDQMAVLDEFERRSWPPCIDVRRLKASGAGRLASAETVIGNLNRKLCGGISFHGDGTKHGICWHLCDRRSTGKYRKVQERNS